MTVNTEREQRDTAWDFCGAAAETVHRNPDRILTPLVGTMNKLRLCALLQLCLLAAAQRTVLDSPINLLIYRELRKWILNNFGSTQEGRELSAKAANKVQQEVSPDVPFFCNVTGGRSPEVPTSVHRLRPGDIDVIAAMGDSLTAGAGIFAVNLLQIGIENRGVAASIGGQGNWRTHLTLPNILKEFNPNLIGYATGDSLTSHPASQLNVAEIGAMSRDMPFMAAYLVRRMKKDPRIESKKHWKLISLFIGSNDFCADMCTYDSPWSVLKNHKADLVKTLRILRDNLPRAFVALHLPAHLSTLVDTRKGRYSLQCYTTTTIECPCLFALQYRHRRQEYYDIMTRWQTLEEEIAELPEFHTEDFTVVVLPILKRSRIPLAEDGFADMSFLSSDCFHITQKGNAWYANGIWNNLLEPYGNKSEAWEPPYRRLLCPTAKQPFLFTRENSRLSNELA